MDAEGWYQDPYKRHGDRWFSDGRATALVRDDHVEGLDEPPTEPYPRPLLEVSVPQAADAQDLRRADDAVSGDPDNDRTEAIFDMIAGTTPID